MQCRLLLLWLMAPGVCGCEVPIAIDLPRGDALNLQEQLSVADVRATMHATGGAPNGYVVEVPHDAVAAAMSALCGAAEGAKSDPCVSGKATTSWLPSPQQEAAARLEARECALSSDLLALPQVQQARVRLSWPQRPLDEPATAAASVLLVVSEQMAEAPIRAYVSSAVAGASPDDISVTQRLAESPHATIEATRWASLGPLRLAEESRGLAKALLAGLLLTNLISAGALLLVWHRLRRKL